MSYATQATPVFLTHDTCYPVLIGQVSSSSAGLLLAEERASHAAAIALKSQFSLCWKAYGKNHAIVKELYGQALVFSLYHNSEVVYVSAYYALLKDQSEDG